MKYGEAKGDDKAKMSRYEFLQTSALYQSGNRSEELSLNNQI